MISNVEAWFTGENNLQEPNFEQSEDLKAILYQLSTHQVPTKYPPSTQTSTVEVRSLLKVMEGEMSRQEIQDTLSLKDRRNFRENYLDPALADEIIEMKYPESPNHPKQKYLITEKGNEIKKLLE